MRVLVACEYSGRVRDAFAARGHAAWSCDLLPTESVGNHYQGDVRDILLGIRGPVYVSMFPWDMLLAFPPCTYLCRAGIHWNSRRPGRAKLTKEALAFVKTLLSAPISKIALENPIGCISTRIRKPDQVVQPWQFGHPENKTTCLWLKGLPLLRPTNVLPFPASGRWDNQTPSGQNKLGPSTNRAKIRSLTHQGIADAMANQWG